MKKALILTLLTVVFVGCSSDSENKNESLSYEFSYNGCNTGKHQFNSKAEMCQALQDNELNNGCAIGMRASHFDLHCPGQTFTAFNKKPQSQTQNQFAPQHNDEPSEPATESKVTEDASGKDTLVGDTLIRTLKAGSASLVLFKNPTDESARSMVFCAADAKSAKEFLASSEMGGMILTLGTKIVLKNDQSQTFTDGTNLKGTYIQIECK
ncbi:hypothetical protein AZI86_16095 [Bdellovibrio bacteriovorus]|uniref:Lipoprotein n=1 Tax=Bdellovibrio bacteriovorus TaxID=959 RepID=A0A150WHR0_BDEBC|nr:hypothetical protein [Bdellovibrio bacteriovorus]KYG63222.1 hypothetical protein AZI86_16095 [Bdellovibrio bacteriovorus]